MYADFLLPHLADGFRVLDIGCGAGSITLGLAAEFPGAHFVGVDPEDEFEPARRHAAEHAIGNVEFCAGDVYRLELPADHFDACLCHSMLETLDRPLDGLVEIKRVLKPGGVLGVACVEYGGLILAGPDVEVLRRFYALRERLWLLDWHADPYRGRELRGLLERAGYDSVVATTTYHCYGTPEQVRSFGDGPRRRLRRHVVPAGCDRARTRHRRRTWTRCARRGSSGRRSPDAYAAFAWCRALGRKPG